ncbi:hypothetical protein TKK_0017262 [Trichogramma kaykai]
MQVNAYSLRKQFAVVRDQMLALEVDVLSVYETWLTPNVDTLAVAVPGYKLYRNDRQLPSPNPRQAYMFGGGVACYVRDDLLTKIVYNPKITHIDENEVLSVAIAFAKRKILLTSVYRHPKGNYCNPLFEHFQSICHNYDHHIFVGDFNANMLSQDEEANSLRSLVDECSLELIPSGPTHHTNFTDTWIDLAFVDSMSQVHSYVKSTVPFIHGHDFFYLDYIIGAPAAVTRPRLSRNLSNVNKTLFLSQLDACLSTLSSSLSSCDDTNLMLEEFNARILGVLDDHAPLRLTRRRRVSAPWFMPLLRQRCKERDRIYKTARRLNDGVLLRRYRCLRKTLQRDIELARTNYLRDGLSSTAGPCCCLEPVSARLLLGRRSHPALAVCQCSPEFRFSEAFAGEVLEALLHVARGARGSSCDGISLRFFDGSYHIIAPFLAQILNVSTATANYPALWKRPTIVPLSKVSRPQSPAQTRPIANLPHLARACDRIITQQMVAHLESNSLLSKVQSGFRNGYSTQTALLKGVGDLHRAVEDGHVTVIVLFDFKCAFDMLDYTVLLTRLRALGFTADALRFVRSYLGGRAQAVADSSGPASAFLPLTSDVPQGSSPAPILFATLAFGAWRSPALWSFVYALR